MQNCLCLYLLPLLLAYFVAALFVASVFKISGIPAQMRGQGTINILAVELIPPQQTFYFSRHIFIFVFLLGLRSCFFCHFVANV